MHTLFSAACPASLPFFHEIHNFLLSWHIILSGSPLNRLLCTSRLAIVQEIYGLEQSVAAARADDPDNEERLCVICLVNERDTTVLPCRHM